MGYYYIETDRGAGIREARTLRQAERDALREAGTYGEPRVRRSTDADIAWVKAMGGWLPDALRAAEGKVE